jgi:ribosomal protein S18 acetylase RimI-like enzyme
MTLEIRSARTDEYAEIGDLVVAGYATLRDRAPGYDAVLRDVAARAASAEVLVALLDGAIVGSVTYVGGPGPQAEVDDPDAATIRMLAVAPEARGHGVGAALVEACIERARNGGRRRVILDTRESMTAAHRLYERVGFVRDATLNRRPTEAPELLLLGCRLELTAEPVTHG